MGFTITHIHTVYNRYCDNCGKKAKNLKEIGIDDFASINVERHKLYACKSCLNGTKRKSKKQC